MGKPMRCRPPTESRPCRLEWRWEMRKVTVLLGVTSLIGVGTLVLAGGSASAQSTCDFLTGGGYIIRPSGAKANFGVAGGCKGGSPTWGHLEYTDRGEGLQVKWTRITAYFFDSVGAGMDHKPTGTRFVCGTARTNRTSGDVDRSEERRVGKECRSRWSPYDER